MLCNIGCNKTLNFKSQSGLNVKSKNEFSNNLSVTDCFKVYLQLQQRPDLWFNQIPGTTKSIWSADLNDLLKVCIIKRPEK